MKGIYECAVTSPSALDLAYFDEIPAGVAFKNGFAVVTQAGIELRPKSPSNKALTAQPFDYDDTADCDEWKATLRRVFDGDPDSEDKRRLLQEFVGASIVGKATDYAACLVLVGEGANGKSVVAETIAEQLFPEDAVTYTTPQSWGRTFTLSRLRNSRLNVATELPDAELSSSDVFKAVVDGGRLEVEDKNKDPYTMRPKAGHVFLANSLPATRDNSRGFWRRFLVIEFNRDFTKDPQQETKEAVKARLRQESAGIMLWALHGAVRLLKQGRYTVPSSHHKVVGEWRTSTDQVAAFIDECCSLGEIETSARDVFEAFREWCGRSGRVAVNNSTFGKRLKSAGIEARRSNEGAMYRIEVLPRVSWALGKLKSSANQEKPVTGVTGSDGSFSPRHQMQLGGMIMEQVSP
jgi:putative DNA primase/helicase